MEMEQKSEVALTAGEILMANGAEAYRVEETISAICRSYGGQAECMTVPGGILLEVTGPDGRKYAQMRKADQRHVDLYRIELINAFSRHSTREPLPYDQAMARLEEIRDAPNFTLRVRTLAAAMTGCVYAVFFGGSLWDGAAAVLVCIFTYLVMERVGRMGFFQFLEYFFAGLIIGGGSLLAQLLIHGVNANNTITGAIMILIPGVVLTNGIKDVLYGNFSAGAARFSEALVIIIAISMGVAAALVAARGWM